ncbi:hypothetical protein FYK55_27090 [Roseiconus nitratireducens]|uniref:Uncharacterized protein n=1 Tax=Roseiconus nitratireducens TaxID=2605748 RepID=A0A5M6CW88_9BACT|nr:hypothetical protein [Roseiconus nitratireducens]KAA5538650.1 hypothetical protein FYK55_27090 [Roseiconus nitratireducens]
MFRVATNSGAIEGNRAPHRKIAPPKNEIEAKTMPITCPNKGSGTSCETRARPMIHHGHQNHVSLIRETPQKDGCHFRRPRRRSQRFSRTLAFSFVVVALATGCVPSLHPFYNKDETQFDAELVGSWDAKTGPIRGRWKFSRYRNDASYRLEFTTEDDKTDVFSAHLFEVGDRRYLDLCLSEHNEEFEQLSDLAKVHLFSFHTVAQLALKEDALTIAFLDSRWVGKYLSENPTELQHARRTRVILTASTQDLQAFIRKHADDPAAWHRKVWLRRLSPPDETPSKEHDSK